MTLKKLGVCLTLIILNGCSAIIYDEGKAKQLLIEGQPQAAYTHYQYLADFGLPRAQRNLGDLYLQQGDEEQALIWLSKAGATGDRYARLKQARILSFSQNPNVRDLPLGRTLIMGLVEEDFEPAIKDLVKLVQQDDDFEIPVDYLVSAENKARAGQPTSCYLLAEIYQSKYAPNMSAEQARDYYICAADQHIKAVYGLASLYNLDPELGDFEQIFDLLQSSKSKAAKSVALNLGKLIAKGSLSSWRYSNAESLMLWSASSVNKAYYELALFYLKKPTQGKTIEDITNMLRLGQDAGSIACYALEAQLSLYGWETSQDPWRAETLLLEIPESSAYSDYLLGVLYSEGFLGEPNYTKALIYLESSSTAGFRKADLQLSKVYSQGLGFPADLVVATMHQLLAKSNHERFARFKEKFQITEQCMVEASVKATQEQSRRLAFQLNITRTNQDDQ